MRKTRGRRSKVTITRGRRWESSRIKKDIKKFFFFFSRILSRLPRGYGTSARLPHIFHASSTRLLPRLPRGYGATGTSSSTPCYQCAIKGLRKPPSSKWPPFASYNLWHRRRMSPMAFCTKEAGKDIAILRRRFTYCALVSSWVLLHPFS